MTSPYTAILTESRPNGYTHREPFTSSTAAEAARRILQAAYPAHRYELITR